MIFRPDHPFMRLMSVVGSLIWINVLALLCCIPLVTVGASLTAAHYVCLRVVRGDDEKLTRSFFNSFRENFRQATIIWLLSLLVFAILAGDLYLIHLEIVTVPALAEYLIYGACILVVLLHTNVYPVLAKFGNSLLGTLKNALYISFLQMPQTVLAAVLSVLPFAALLLYPIVLVITLIFGISGPAYIFARMYNKFFAKLEKQTDPTLESTEANTEA